MECEKINALLKIIPKKQQQGIILEALKRYNVPIDKTRGIVMLSEPCDNVNPFVVFSVIDSIKDIQVSNYFNDAEIKMFKNKKFPSKEIDLKFKAMIINDDQYCSKITARELFMLCNENKINYNINTQRVLTWIVSGNTKTCKITINKNSVNQIANILKTGEYIPNTITLNIPEDNVWEYDDKNGILDLSKVEYFDIIDGYHRLLALNRCCVEDENFDYPMEIRFVSFSETKAKQFIFQQNKQNKMREETIRSYDQTSNISAIIKRINTDFSFYLKGEIAEGKLIQTDLLYKAISFYESNKKPLSIVEKNTIARKIVTIWNMLIDEDPEYLTSLYDSKKIAIVISICMQNKDEINAEKIYKQYSAVKDMEIAVIRKDRFSYIKKVSEAIVNMGGEYNV